MIEYQVISKIHQVLILDEDQRQDHLPDLIQINTDCVRNLYPQANYKLWSGQDLRGFISESFEPDVLWAFDTLRPYSYKCDLGRFCLLYVFGGLYVDLGVRMMNLWKIPTSQGIAAFRDVPFTGRSWSSIQTGLLWAKPRRPEFRHAIEWIVENCRNHYYGQNPLYPTGPVLLGRAFIAAMVAKGQTDQADDQRIGTCRSITPDAVMLNISYVSREGVFIGLRTKVVGGDLSHLGLSGGNNYNDIWDRCQVYGELDRSWDCTDVRVIVEDRAARTKTGIVVLKGAIGRICYGPFVSLDAGSYRLRIDFSSGTSFSGLAVNISARHGAETVHQATCTPRQAGAQDGVEIDFLLDKAQHGVEFRLSVFGDFSGEVKKFTLRQTKVRVWAFDDGKVRLPDLRQSATGALIPAGTKGCVVYGPYAQVYAGLYALKATFGPQTRFTRLLVDVCAEGGNEVLHEHLVEHGPDQQATAPYEEVQFEFRVQRQRTDVEFRIMVFGDFAGEFRKFTLTPVEQPAFRH